MREEGIPIDLIGGTSSGSFIAGLYASGRNLDDVASIFAHNFVVTKWLSDFTLPVMSFLSGKHVNRSLRSSFGETHIEDLKLPMFCVSTNLSTRRQTIHLSGSLWQSVRASVALPPFLPPVVSEEGFIFKFAAAAQT